MTRPEGLSTVLPFLPLCLLSQVRSKSGLGRHLPHSIFSMRTVDPPLTVDASHPGLDSRLQGQV